MFCLLLLSYALGNISSVHKHVRKTRSLVEDLDMEALEEDAVAYLQGLTEEEMQAFLSFEQELEGKTEGELQELQSLITPEVLESFHAMVHGGARSLAMLYGPKQARIVGLIPFAIMAVCLFSMGMEDRGLPLAGQPPSGWTCSDSWYFTDDGCDCNCGVWDDDCSRKVNGDPLQPDYGTLYGCPSGDFVCVNVGGAPQCQLASVALTWTCPEDFYASGDGCDCNCGSWDPDCDTQDWVYGCTDDQDGDTIYSSYDFTCVNNGGAPQCQALRNVEARSSENLKKDVGRLFGEAPRARNLKEAPSTRNLKELQARIKDLQNAQARSKTKQG